LKDELKCENIDVIEKQIAGFFKKLKVEGLSNGNVRKLLTYDGNTSIESICNMTKEDFKKVPGFQEKMASKISDSIKDRLQSESLPNIMAASNVFGRGFSDKRMKEIMETEPEILITSHSEEEKIRMVTNVNGISIKMAKQFVENIDKFITFMKKINMAAKLLPILKKEEEKSEILLGKSYALTGFRDEELQEYITQNGGKIVATLTKKTTGLIVKDTDYKANTKTAQAEQKNIPIITREEFYETYK
jgi:DNA ligase (NAD+)